MIPGRRVSRVSWFVLAALPLAAIVTGEARQAPTAAASAEYFEAKIRPLLAANCYDCHTDERHGGLRVDSREALLKGGRSGPAIVPGDPDHSLLIQAVRQTSDKLKMPKGGRLEPAEIDALVEWVRAGAPWPVAANTVAADQPAVKTAPPVQPADSTKTEKSAGNAPTKPTVKPYVITAEQRAFWSFQPLQKAVVPAVAHAEWPKTDIDRFVLARLEREGLAPVRAADKLTLIRRATLDLTGLPPTVEEIDAFREGRIARRVRQGGGPAARVAALRRGVGPPLARRGALWRRRLPLASTRWVAGTTRIRMRTSIATG